MTFDAIVETLKEDGRIELRNFGVFEVKLRKARRARNPRTNQPVDVEAKNVVTFQPGKDMEEKVRNTKPVALPRTRPSKASSAPSNPVIVPNPAPAVPTASDMVTV
jgi:nucleoid DNA-binding protein